MRIEKAVNILEEHAKMQSKLLSTIQKEINELRQRVLLLEDKAVWK